MRLDAKLDSMTSLRITPNISWNNTRYNNLNNQQVEEQGGQLLSQNLTDYGLTGTGMNGSNNLLLMRKFRREGRTFSLNLNTVLNGQDTRGLNRATNTFFGLANPTGRVTKLNQQNEQGTNAWNNTLTLSFTEPLSLSKKAEFRYAYADNQNLSTRDVNDFNEVTNLYDRFNVGLSNDFRNTFRTHRLGTTLQNRRLRYTYSIGMDLQQAELRANNRTVDTTLSRGFTNLLPNGMFSYNWTRNRSLRINYRTRINAPTVSQLQPVPDNTNPLQIRLGNPNLKPEFYNTLSMTYNNFSSVGARSLFAMLNINQVNRRIVNATTFDRGVQTTQPVNADGYYAVNGFLSLGRRIQSWKINLNTSTNAGYSRGIGFVNGEANYSNNLSVGQGASMNSVFNGKFEFGLVGNITYQRATYSLQPQQNNAFFTNMGDVNIYWQLPHRFVLTSDLLYMSNTGRSAGYNQTISLWNIGLARQLFKNKQGELKLQVYDLLNQNKSIVRNITETYVEDVQSRILRRYFLLSFTYNLRKFGV